MPGPPPSKSGTPHLLFGATLISFSGVFVKDAQPRGVEAGAAGFWRMLFGGLLLVGLARLRMERFWNGRGPFLFQCIAGLLFAADLTVWHRSIHLVGVGLSTLLANFQVFILALVGVFFLRERPTWKRRVSIPLAVLGLYLIVGPDWQGLGEEAKLGIGLGLLTACFYAAYILVLPATQPRGGRATHLANVSIISLLTTLFLGLEVLLLGEDLGISGARAWADMLAYGFLCQAFGQLLLYKGRLLSEASKVGLLILLQPTLAYFWDILFFAKEMRLHEVLGALLALFAIHLGSTSERSVQAS